MIFNRPTCTAILLLMLGPALSHGVVCLENGRFYRNPDRPTQKIWTPDECSKYFLCLEGEVFDFKCSNGLLFNVDRQICDFKLNVDNCDITSEATVPGPLLSKANCAPRHLGCADGTCLPHHYFCDGAPDCPDGSDEDHCTGNDPEGATPCNPSSCTPPGCFCSPDGTQIPGNLPPSQTPQMIILSFDGAINFDNWELYSRLLFNNSRNPNGCPIKATFFVSHQHNDYHQTQKLWNDGHEVAVHSISRRGPEEWWSSNATVEDWFDEMVGQANIIHKYGGVRMGDIRGLRVPFLQVGWNRQFLMMQEVGFVYDSSIVAPFSNPPVWPYTMDHKPPHNCTNQNCPSRSYQGLWEMVINQLEADGFSCPMIDSCTTNLTGNDVYRLLVHNFRRHYLTNRAPFSLPLHSAWFRNRDNLDAFLDFVEEVQQFQDVWFVTNWQVIRWMRKPTPLDKLDTFKEWGCDRAPRREEVACKQPNVCQLYSERFQQERLLHTCFRCPQYYPWVKNEFGVY